MAGLIAVILCTAHLGLMRQLIAQKEKNGDYRSAKAYCPDHSVAAAGASSVWPQSSAASFDSCWSRRPQPWVGLHLGEQASPGWCWPFWDTQEALVGEPWRDMLPQGTQHTWVSGTLAPTHATLSPGGIGAVYGEDAAPKPSAQL